MRQLRIKSEPCSYPKLRTDCLTDYNFFNEEKHSFTPGWTNISDGKSNSSIDQAFQYRSNDQLDTYIYVGEHGTYSGNGYIYQFRGRLNEIRTNLSELHQLEWIDNSTRAVIIQFSLYNPNVQLFTSATLLIEILSSGGIFPTARFEPFIFTGNISLKFFDLLYFYLAFTSKFQLICTIIYMLMIVYFMFIEIQSFIHSKSSYFRQFQSYIEWSIIIASWTSLGIYIWAYREFNRIGSLFRETNGYVYINFQLASYVHDILIYSYGICSFFSTIKLLHLCRFNQRLLLFNQTLQNCARELVSFGMMFSIVFVAFLCLFYFLFNPYIQSCSSLLQTSRMLFEMTLMKFDAHELIEANAVLGPISFSLFILLVVFVCLSMFISIISDNFRLVRENRDKRKDEEIFSFMLDKFLRWTGQFSNE